MSRRLYAQLQPTAVSLAHLLQVQAQIPGRGRLVAAQRIHLTLIHFGIVTEIVEQLPCRHQQAEAALDRYIAATNHILTRNSLYPQTLQPLGFEVFGRYRTTLVIRYQSTPRLVDIHAQLLSALRSFFADCGVADVNAYMRADDNFQHALTLAPHITLAKNYDGKLPLSSALEPIQLSVMPFEYEQ